ncbi:hypothetical protein EKK58_12555 [Candidatus Dependentiae bacterium]|nr:MAG: hypothetical protein EKK58_12555 [Candidatus Dependentiae bacterium]
MSTHTQHIRPNRLTDKELEQHIRRTLLQLESILMEMNHSWNKPKSHAIMATLREQLIETSESLNAATDVWEYRQITMR